MHGNATATEDQQVSAQYENEINEIGKLIKLKQICLSFEEENRVRVVRDYIILYSRWSMGLPAIFLSQ